MKISRGRPTFMKSLKKVSSGIGTLKRVRPFVSMQTTIKIRYAKVSSIPTSIFTALYGMAWPDSLVRNFKDFKIVLLEFRRAITKYSYDTSSRFLLNSLGWDNVSVRRAKQKANLMYKCINNLTLAYLCNLSASRTPNCYFLQRKDKLMLPKPRPAYLKRSFSYSGCLLWISLAEEIRTSSSLGLLKRSSHRWFSDQYSHTANM